MADPKFFWSCAADARTAADGTMELFKALMLRLASQYAELAFCAERQKKIEMSRPT